MLVIASMEPPLLIRAMFHTGMPSSRSFLNGRIMDWPWYSGRMADATVSSSCFSDLVCIMRSRIVGRIVRDVAFAST